MKDPVTTNELRENILATQKSLENFREFFLSMQAHDSKMIELIESLSQDSANLVGITKQLTDEVTDVTSKYNELLRIVRAMVLVLESKKLLTSSEMKEARALWVIEDLTNELHKEGS